MTENYKKLASEAFKLHHKIKLDSLRLKNIKNQLLQEMVRRGSKKIDLSEGSISVHKWKAKYSIEDGLKKTICWYKTNKNQVSSLRKIYVHKP